MRVIKNPAWVYYIADKDPDFDENKVGKWMHFFADRLFVENVCKAAIKEGIVEECKHSNASEGVSCFYLNDDDLEGHRRVIEFFIKNNLIRKTKKGKLYNISFKHDTQTLAGEYGDDYHSDIKLEEFVNLETGEFKMNNKENTYSDILFGYMNTPSYGEDGDDGGFSIAIYPNGKLIYKTYIFDEIEETRREIELDLETVKDISKVLSFYKQEINELDEDIDNGSLDGYGNFFIFAGKRIITWNIQYLDEDEIKKLDQEYYEEYLPVIKQQNLIIEIFCMIAEILDTEGIDLRPYEVIFKETENNK